MNKWITCFAILICLPAWCMAGDELFKPGEYVQAKLKVNDIVFLGTTHKKPPILGFMAGLIPSLKDLGVSHVGLEIPSDQQNKIDTYMKTGNGLSDVRFHPQIDCPEYRHLFTVLRKAGGPSPIAIDLPRSEYSKTVSRDEWIARSILTIFKNERRAKLFVIVGNLHTLKKLEWEDHIPNKRKSIRQYIQFERPSTKMWSIGQVIDENIDECDFTVRFASLPGAVAMDLDSRFRGWKLGSLAPIAIVPAECFELVDGLIIY